MTYVTADSDVAGRVSLPDFKGLGQYRFTGSMTKMATRPQVIANPKSTNAMPGYIDADEHPKVPPFATKEDVKVCWDWYNVFNKWTTCAYSLTISITNCGKFYLYTLPNVPVCHATYSGSD